MQHNRYFEFARPIDHYILDNGHEIVYIEHPGCDVAEIQLTSFVGAYTDTIPGSLHFYEHLMVRNVKNRLRGIDQDHGLINDNAFTNWHMIAFTGDTTNEGATHLLKAWYEQLSDPLLTPSGFESERKIILAEEREKQDRNEYHIQDLRVRCLDPERFWTTIGSADDIQRLTPDDIIHSYEAILDQPLLVAIVGAVRIQDIIGEVSAWHTVTNGHAEAPSSDKFRIGSTTFAHHQHSLFSLSCMYPYLPDQVEHLRFGYMYDLIAHGKYGLLHKILREENSDVYGVGLNAYSLWLRYGSIEIRGIPDSDKRDAMVNEVLQATSLKVLPDHLRKHFDAVKRDYVLRFKLDEIHRSISASTLSTFIRKRGYTTPPANDIYTQTTIEDLLELAHRVFDPEKMGFVLLDPT